MIRSLICLFSSIGLLLSACSPTSEGDVGSSSNAGLRDRAVAFEWFEYRGSDPIFSAPLAEGEYQNPILSGFYPDPSITRRGDDYYLVNSSFGYLPGLPIWQSRDLVSWKLIGHALDRPEQLDFSKNGGIEASYGIFAPTLRYHQGLFYLVSTAVYSGGNFLLTAKVPAGPWSDPHWLPEIGGIDPDIFFDDDGRVYILHNTEPVGGSTYEGHRAIWIWEYDLDAKKVVPNSGRQIINGGVDLSAKPIWIEGPHLYKIDGWYYLTCAEGGTGPDHSQVIFRTDSLDKPFRPFSANPILTQRDLPKERPDPVGATGHADFIQTPSGEWWAVFLATRPYQRAYHNTGRETFLLRMSWNDGWPTILKNNVEVPYRASRPKGGERLEKPPLTTGNFVWRDEFNQPEINNSWLSLRSLNREWLSLDGERLWISPRPERLTGLGRPAYLGVRQKHQNFRVETELRAPDEMGVSAGIAAFQNEKSHFYLAVRRTEGEYELFIESVSNGDVERLLSKTISEKYSSELGLAIGGEGETLAFYYRLPEGDWQTLASDLDARQLSTEIAGGFLGVTLGVHSRVE